MWSRLHVAGPLAPLPPNWLWRFMSPIMSRARWLADQGHTALMFAWAIQPQPELLRNDFSHLAVAGSVESWQLVAHPGKPSLGYLSVTVFFLGGSTPGQ
ncbi:MAG: hypothetical protein ACYCX9_08895 [Candidatus Dormibacteria bacterium]